MPPRKNKRWKLAPLALVFAYAFSLFQLYTSFRTRTTITTGDNLCTESRGRRRVPRECLLEMENRNEKLRVNLFHEPTTTTAKTRTDRRFNYNNNRNTTKIFKNKIASSTRRTKMYKHRCTGHDGEQLVYPQYPTFVIAGAQKTGTTSLLSYFAKHPLIAKPALHEPHFFDKRIHSMLREGFARYPAERITRNETWCHIGHEYYKLLVDPDATRSYPYSFEKTPSYLHRFTAPRNLRKTCPWIPKVIITLRNPVDRAYSNYHMGNQRLKFFANETGNNQTFPFEHYIKEEIDMMRSWRMTTAPPFPDDNGTTPIQMPTWDHPGHESHWTNLSGILFNENDNPHHGLLLRKGIYAPQLRRWLKFYPRDSIMVLDYRELQQNTSDVYFRILDFAGIPRDQPEHSFRAKRSSDYESMSNTTRAYLEAFFAPYNAELQDLLGEEWKGAWTSDW